MMKRSLVQVGVAVVLAIIAGVVGYHIRARQNATQEVDRVLSGLTLNVMILDAVESKRADDLRPILTATLESDFYRMVLLWEKHGPAQADRQQCAVAKRIRKLRRDGRLFVDEQEVIESGIDVEVINRYLATECLGEPKRDSWMPASGGL
jgi:hypothetical protein